MQFKKVSGKENDLKKKDHPKHFVWCLHMCAAVDMRKQCYLNM